MADDAREAEFREAEKRLDALLAEAHERLVAGGIEFSDKSLRSYHYKNQILIWEALLERSWLVSHERAQVMVRLFFAEPLVPGNEKVKISRHSEVFQQGQESRVSLRSEAEISISELEHIGLAVLAEQQLRAGTQELEKNI